MHMLLHSIFTFFVFAELTVVGNVCREKHAGHCIKTTEIAKNVRFSLDAFLSQGVCVRLSYGAASATRQRHGCLIRKHVMGWTAMKGREKDRGSVLS